MSEQEKKCVTCGGFNGGEGGAACVGCDKDGGYAHWTPKPAPEPALPTLEEFDAWIEDTNGCEESCACRFQRLRTLVEEAECKAAIVAAGCEWAVGSDGNPHRRILVTARDGAGTTRVPTWPEARRWSEEQHAKREAGQWSPPVWDMCEDEVSATLAALGAPAIAGAHADRCAFLRGYASALGRYDKRNWRIWLGPLPIPTQ